MKFCSWSLGINDLMSWACVCRRTLEAAGPAFMKWGQWAATRADLFPPDMCGELEQLQSSAPVHPLTYTKAAIHHALGTALINTSSIVG